MAYVLMVAPPRGCVEDMSVEDESTCTLASSPLLGYLRDS